mmetsp:Transcript_2621/g.4975  ORF Transcript_2621/g.4975 Transcript_2621/m.4975 type:complete len:224 (+) Transcript_2621:579-1250(+)
MGAYLSKLLDASRVTASNMKSRSARKCSAAACNAFPDFSTAAITMALSALSSSDAYFNASPSRRSAARTTPLSPRRRGEACCKASASCRIAARTTWSSSWMHPGARRSACGSHSSSRSHSACSKGRFTSISWMGLPEGGSCEATVMPSSSSLLANRSRCWCTGTPSVCSRTTFTSRTRHCWLADTSQLSPPSEQTQSFSVGSAKWSSSVPIWQCGRGGNEVRS